MCRNGPLAQVVDVDELDNVLSDSDDNLNGLEVGNGVDPDDEDAIEVVEQPVESEEGELSKCFNNDSEMIVLFAYPMQSALDITGVHLFMHSLIQ